MCEFFYILSIQSGVPRHTIKYELYILPYYLSYDGCHCEDDLCDADGVDSPLVEVPLVVILVGSLAVLLVYAFWLLDLLQKFTGRARSSIT